MPETTESDDKPLLKRAIEKITNGVADSPRPPQAKLGGWIAETLDEQGSQKHLAARAPTGTGKALDVDTPIPTPRGWKKMGQLTAGDEIFDETGSICHVVVAHPIQHDRECYVVIFDDYSSIIADAEHLWPTQTRKLRQQRSEARRRPTSRRTLNDLPEWEVMTTEEMADSMHGQGGALNHAVAVAGGIQSRDADLPIDPYVLGVWLGDGNSLNSGITTPDEEIVKAIRDRGYLVEKLRGELKYSIHMGTGKVDNRWYDSFTKRLGELGVKGDKHIPSVYLRASYGQRMALLRGLMDTDGTIGSTGRSELCLTRERLINDAYELISSLGIKATLKSGVAAITETHEDGTKYRRDAGIRWRIGFTTSLPVFSLAKKTERLPQVTRETSRLRYIKQIQKVASRPVRCVGVDSPNHLFLAGETMIPTHNSLSYLAPAFDRAVKGERTLISTEGLGLQRQITSKDAPAVAAATNEKHGVDVKTSVLKGFSNYVCAKKTENNARQLLGTKGSLGGAELADAVESAQRPDSEQVRLGPVTSTWGTLKNLFIWALRDGDSLDRDDCPVELPSGEWQLVSLSAQECVGKKCPLFDYCAPQTSRREAAESQIVVTNHTMLALQAAKKIPVVIGNDNLGPFDHIIVDEAHALPGIVRSQGSVEISEPRIERLAKRLAKEGAAVRPPNWFLNKVDEVRSAAGFAMKGVEKRIGNARVGEDIRLEEKDQFTDLNAVSSGFGGLKEAIKKNTTVFEEDEAKELTAAIDSLADDIEAVTEHKANVARWLVRDSTPNGSIMPKVCASPVDVGSDLYFNVWTTDGDGESAEIEMLNEELESGDLEPHERASLIEEIQELRATGQEPRNELSVAAVSATLSPSYPYETGLRTKIRDVPTPFDEAYVGSAVYTPMPLPEDIAEIAETKWGKPKLNTQAHIDWCIEQISELLYANGGAGMVISATATAGRRYAEALRADETLGFEVYTQWDARGKASTIEAWKADDSSVIVGTKSLMTGVDAPGDTNTIVIVDRPPRAPLNPVDKARCEVLIAEGENKFIADSRVYVEDASVLLEQAIGRLIRTHSDRGMAVVLDPRLPKDSPMAYGSLVRKIYTKALKPYGEQFNYLDHALDWLEERRAGRA